MRDVSVPLAISHVKAIEFFTLLKANARFGFDTFATVLQYAVLCSLSLTLKDTCYLFARHLLTL